MKYLPLKFVGVVNYAGKRERVRLAIRHDADWSRHYPRSKYKDAYWYTRVVNGSYVKMQIASVVVEYRTGAKLDKLIPIIDASRQ